MSITHTIIDYADPAAGLTSMQRLVGFTVAIAAGLIAREELNERGLILPMRIPLALIRPELARRNIHIATRLED